MAIHKFIKKLRKNKKISQQHIAELLGCTRQTFTQIENGNRDISLGESRKLAELFEIPLDKFITEQETTTYKVELELSKVKESSEQKYRISVPQNKVEKFKEVLLYILGKIGAEPHIGQTAIYKHLYFIDFDYYEKYEEQLIGARYQKNHFGPTPIEFNKITSDMIKKQELEQVNSKYFTYEQKKYLPCRSANLNILTGQEVKHIDEVLARLSQKNAKELSDYSHQDVPWIIAKDGDELEYEAVFYRTHETTVRSYD